MIRSSEEVGEPGRREVGHGSRQAWAERAPEGQRAKALGLVPGAARDSPVEPAAGRSAVAAVAAVALPFRHSQ